jgi:hypothetical protein
VTSAVATPPPESGRTFEALCILASQEGWCWHVPCTTCGNQEFRLALWELGEGRLSGEWWSLARNRRSLPQRLRHLDAFRPWPLAAQRKLIAKIAVARLVEIAHDGRFPDWLGLLGVALLQTEDAEAVDHVLTAAWGRQLLSLLPEHARSASTFAGILRDESAILTWRNLEDIERALSTHVATSEEP